MRVAVAVATLMILASCSQSTSGSGTGDGSPQGEAGNTAPSPQGIECDEIWQVGNTLPDDYRECVDQSGKVERTDYYTCMDGSFLYIHEGMWAARGHPVGIALGRRFDRAVTACQTA